MMMIFRPQGIISNIRQKYEYKGLKEETENG
jgi:branched-chain amino acid transport system permease protein